MPIEYSQDIHERIQAQLASGLFSSEEDVLREALDTLEKRQRGMEHLRGIVSEADDDIAAGRVAEFDREQTKRCVLDRLNEQGIR